MGQGWFYTIACHKGAVTTVKVVFHTWALNIDEAWANARRAGLVPLHII